MKPRRLRIAITLVSVSVACAGLLVAGMPVGATPPPPSWKINSAPHLPGPLIAELHGIACPLPTSCFAVGNGSGPGIAEHWNGSSWTFTQMAKPVQAKLNAVACPSSSSCFAVGENAGGPALIEHFNGTSWTMQTVPQPAASTNAVLNGVSCVSTTTCFAAGDSENNVFGITTLVERWNGTKWSVMTSANVFATARDVLNGLKCTSSTNCMAVGSVTNGDMTTLTERWNGTSWSVVSSPNPGGAVNSHLSSVSCPSASSCFAVGSSNDGAVTSLLVEHWNASTWSIVTIVNPPFATLSELSGVTCVSTTSCFAVGDFKTNGSNLPLVEQLTVSGWEFVSSPSPNSSLNSTLSAVSCHTSTSCLAAGALDARSTLTERWNGAAWSIGAAAAGASQSAFEGISCWSATRCFAVGSRETPAEMDVTLIERWNGSSWSAITSPNPAGSDDTSLSAVECRSSASCLAVGFDLTTGVHAVTERWNGTSWSLVANPTPGGATFVSLDDVSCATSTSCFAVGTYEAAGVDKVLVEHWNGTSWTIASVLPPAGATASGLDGVRCPGATSCFAVGTYTKTGHEHTLVERWSTSGWALLSTPTPASVDVVSLTGISCSTGTRCFAVGDYSTGGPDKTLALQGNGSSWSIVASPNPSGSTDSEISSVSCPVAGTCYMVGDFSVGSPRRVLIEHWNGTKWSVMNAPNEPGANTTTLIGIACTAAANCFATGRFDTATLEYALVERYS